MDASSVRARRIHHITSPVRARKHYFGWDIDGVDPTMLDPEWLTFDSGRAVQKAKFCGEFFPCQLDEVMHAARVPNL